MATLNPQTQITTYAPGELATTASPSQAATAAGGSGALGARLPDGTVAPINTPAQSGSQPDSMAIPANGRTSFNQPKTQYTVLTSAPATANYNTIQSDYKSNIQPALVNSATNNAATNAAANNLPVMDGYTVSPQKTGAPNETTLESNGQMYYATPNPTAPTASDVQSILSGGGSSSTNTATNTPTAQSTPSDQATAQTGVNPSTENANYQGQISGVTDDVTNAYNTFKQTIGQIMSGSFPLSPAQQAMVDATNNAFEAMTTQANLKAAALSSETGGVSTKVNATAGELTNITAQQAMAVAQLEIGFQNQDYKMVTDSYSAFKDLETQKMSAITDLHNSIMDTYNKALSADQAQQTFNQTAFKDAATLAQSQYEFRDAHDQFGNVVGTVVYDKKTGLPVSGGSAQSNGDGTYAAAPIPSVQIQANGTPDSATQQAFLQTIPQPFRQLVQNVANYQQNTSNLSPKTKTQIESWAAQYDPTYDSKQYQTRQALQTNFTSGSYSKNINSLNTAIGHLGDLTSNFSKLGNNSNTYNNATVNFVKGKILGEGGITSAGTNINAAVGELASTFKSGGATDTEIKNLGNVDVNSSPEQAKAFVETGIQLLASRLQALTDTYTAGMGKPPVTNFLSPTNITALSNLKNQGYTVDIPGVNYTTQDAWDKYGGGTQDQWNSSVDALTAAGLPLTTENILQYAQSQ